MKTKLSVSSALVTLVLVFALTYATTPNLPATETFSIQNTNAVMIDDHTMLVGSSDITLEDFNLMKNYLMTVTNDKKSSEFKLTSVANSSYTWPEMQLPSVIVVPLCHIICVVIVLVVLGVVVYIFYKALKCLHGLLNPTNGNGNGDDIIRKLAGDVSENPYQEWILPTFYPVISSTNSIDWIPYYTISNLFQQMSNTSCRIVTTVYDKTMNFIDARISDVSVSCADSNINVPTIYLTNLCLPLTERFEFFRFACSSNYIESTD
jgi:hypothetical protein